MRAHLGSQACLLSITLLAALACDCGSSSGGENKNDPDATLGDATLDDGSSGDGALGDGSSGDAFVPPPRPDVHVVITADNAYGFGYGTSSQLNRYFEGVEDGSDAIFVCSDPCERDDDCGAGIECDIFGTCNADRWGPETYVVPGSDTSTGDYLYIITWSDEAVTQGLIAQFKATNGAPPVYTGVSPDWRVCATGHDYDPGSGGPSLDVINQYIAECNKGAAGTTYSKGWVGTAPNEANQALVVLDPADEEDHNFHILCGRNPSEADMGDAIDPPARWIWFDDDVTDDLTAFKSPADAEHPKYEDPRGDFLIFRLPLAVVVIPG